MENGHLHDDKLFRAVHDRLSDYEAPYDGADWDAMNRSLDKLPKTSRFQWKFSLNTLLVAAAIGGLSLLGYALTRPGDRSPQGKNESSGQPAQTMNEQADVMHTVSSSPAANSKTENTVAQTDPVNSAGTEQTVAGLDQRMQRHSNSKQINESKLLFGDQIDKRKGFIYKTKEDPKLVGNFHDSGAPNVYYDMENGKVRPILIHKDSTGIKAEKKAPVFNSDSAAKSNTGAPTNDNGGFDFDQTN